MPFVSRWLLVGLLAPMSPVFPAPVASPAGPEIRELSIATGGGQVLVSFRLADGFTNELRERIESGLPTSLVYELELLRDRKRWWDRGVDSSRIETVAMYNAVTHEYLVNTKHDGRLIGSRTVRDLDELERAMTELAAFPAFTVEADDSRTRYLVRVRVGLGAGTFLGFIPYQRDSAWTDSNKVRLAPPEP
jgi:hypothetical protein